MWHIFQCSLNTYIFSVSANFLDELLDAGIGHQLPSWQGFYEGDGLPSSALSWVSQENAWAPSVAPFLWDILNWYYQGWFPCSFGITAPILYPLCPPSHPHLEGLSYASGSFMHKYLWLYWSMQYCYFMPSLLEFIWVSGSCRVRDFFLSISSVGKNNSVKSRTGSLSTSINMYLISWLGIVG